MISFRLYRIWQKKLLVGASTPFVPLSQGRSAAAWRDNVPAAMTGNETCRLVASCHPKKAGRLPRTLDRVQRRSQQV
jgi:hypothetical protein